MRAVPHTENGPHLSSATSQRSMNHLPLRPRIEKKLRRFAYYPLDTYDLLVGNRPPDEMIFVGDGSWRSLGNEFLRHFKTLGGLRPHHCVLDIGCGIGRMAAPLTRYLDEHGRYFGFDIVKTGIEWCQNNITPRHSNFIFTHSNVANRHYNPAGTLKASEYVFPFENNMFDFVFLTSVFTHMFPADLENYLTEIARVMKPGGRCLITFFLFNEESMAGIESGRSALPFAKHSPDYYYTRAPADPEAAIGFDEPYVHSIFRVRGLVISEPIQYGSWCGRREYLSFQDIVVAIKR